MKVILASASPRRKELLGLIIPSFEIMESQEKEVLKEGLLPQEQAQRLAYTKANDVYRRTQGDRMVIGADTIVVKEGKIYGKPKTVPHAKQMIKELLAGDKTHHIITGLSIFIEKDGKYEVHQTYDSVKVYLRDMSDDEIDNWIATGKAMDKAGAYGIQNEFCVFIEKIEGNYTTAVGLPMHRVYEIIRGNFMCEDALLHRC